jgi:hypothetical protein
LPLQLFSFAIGCRKRKLHVLLPLAAEVVRGFGQIGLSLLGTPEASVLDSVTAHFVVRMKMDALNSVITAWVLSGHARRTVRVDEAHFMPRMNRPEGEALLDVSCLEIMRL